MLTEQERANQRTELVKSLESHSLIQQWKLEVVKGHGSGSGRNGNTWKWVEIKGTAETEALVKEKTEVRARDFVCVVSLNIQDVSAGQPIAMSDQIGLVVCDSKRIPLDIYLPLIPTTSGEIAEKVIEELKSFLGI